MTEPGRYEISVDLTVASDDAALPVIAGPRSLAGTEFICEEIKVIVSIDRILAGTGHSTTYEGKPVTGTGTLAGLLLGDVGLAEVPRTDLLHAYATLKGCLGVFSDETSFRGFDLRPMRSLVKKIRPLVLEELGGRPG